MDSVLATPSAKKPLMKKKYTIKAFNAHHLIWVYLFLNGLYGAVYLKKAKYKFGAIHNTHCLLFLLLVIAEMLSLDVRCQQIFLRFKIKNLSWFNTRSHDPTLIAVPYLPSTK